MWSRDGVYLGVNRLCGVHGLCSPCRRHNAAAHTHEGLCSESLHMQPSISILQGEGCRGKYQPRGGYHTSRLAGHSDPRGPDVGVSGGPSARRFFPRFPPCAHVRPQVNAHLCFLECLTEDREKAYLRVWALLYTDLRGCVCQLLSASPSRRERGGEEVAPEDLNFKK